MKLSGYIFFDYECMHVNNKHEVNLVVAHRVCIECVNKNQCPKTMCKNYVFYNNNDFGNWLFRTTNFIAIAHNMKSYDGYLIINCIVNNFLPTDSIPEN